MQYGAGRTARQREALFEVTSHSEEQYKKFATLCTRYELKIAKPEPTMNPEKWLRELLEGIISYFKNNSSIDINPGDKIGLTLKNDVCGTEPVYVSLRRADQISADVILKHIMNIFDSNKEFFLNGHLTTQFNHIKTRHGGGDRIPRKFGQSNVDFIQNKACFLKYANPFKNNPNDEYCLPYALIISRAYSLFAGGEKTRHFYQKYQKKFSMLRSAAKKLCRKAGVVMSQLRGGCSFDEVKKFQRVLPEYQIIIFNRFSIKP